MTYDELVDYCKEAGQTISELDYKNRILEKENQELKKQLEEYKSPIKYFKYANKNVTEENKQLKSIIYELREHMLDIDYKMGWEYVEYLDRLLPEKILKEVSDE